MALTELIKPMKQLRLAETGFLPRAGKQTQNAVFLVETEPVVPSSHHEALIAPHYPQRWDSQLKVLFLYDPSSSGHMANG